MPAVEVSTVASPSPDPPVDSDTAVLVDFDHTLFSANSAELFIATCRPSLVAALADLLIRRLVPWRLTGLPRWFRLRDYACIVVLCILTPWNVVLWRRRAPALFDRWLARDVDAWLSGVPDSRIRIVSFGMSFVIRALTARSRYARTAIIATPFLTGLDHFRHGKRRLAVAGIGEPATQAATFITDSHDDADLLDGCARGIRISPRGDPLDARTRLYLPLRYVASAKYGRTYVLDQFLFVDVLIYVLATTHFPGDIGVALAVCPLFALSIACIYELGYFENDMRASQREAVPVLGERVDEFRDYPIRSQAWVWAALSAAAGLAGSVSLLAIDAADAAVLAAGWMFGLVLLRLVFHVYNRMAVRGRIYFYPCLQLLKYGAVFAIFSASVWGIFLVISQVAAMWVTYLLYRLSGDKLAFSRDHFRSALFAMCAFVYTFGVHGRAGMDLSGASQLTAGDWFSLGAIGLWSAFRMFKVSLMKRVKSG